jgi:hypothetical protein
MVPATQLQKLDNTSFGAPFVTAGVDSRFDLQVLDNVSYGAPFVGAGDPPNSPTNLVATAVGATIQLTWDRVADGAVIEVWRKC